MNKGLFTDEEMKQIRETNLEVAAMIGDVKKAMKISCKRPDWPPVSIIAGATSPGIEPVIGDGLYKRTMKQKG